MAAAASWFFDTGVQDHRADVLERPPAELAGEIAGNVAVERFVVAPVGVMYVTAHLFPFLIASKITFLAFSRTSLKSSPSPSI